MYIEHQELGYIKLIASSRAKHIIARYRDQQLQLTYPRSLKLQDVERCIAEMEPRLKNLKEKNNTEKFIFTENVKFSTLTFDVSIGKHDLNNIYSSLKNEVLNISFPRKTNLLDEKTQVLIKSIIENGCRIEANRVLPQKVYDLARKHNFDVNSVKINKSRGRWGSCSTKRNINLSYFCMMLPEHLIDFVVLHELCHTKEMNHGAQFWALLDTVTDNRAEELTKELKNIRLNW